MYLIIFLSGHMFSNLYSAWGRRESNLIWSYPENVELDSSFQLFEGAPVFSYLWFFLMFLMAIT